MSFKWSSESRAGLKAAISKTPDEVLGSGFKRWFAGYEKDAKRILIVTLLTCFFCYFYEMVYGYGCPDALSEGVYYYRNADFATSLARWFVRYFNLALGGNLVIPAVIIPLYCLMIGVSDYILVKMFEIRSPIMQVLLTAVTVSFPVILHHFAFLYIALTYSFSYLLTIIGTKLIREKKVAGFIFGVIAYIFMLGLYQAYIASIAALGFMLLILDLMNGEKVVKSLLNMLKIALAGLVAGAIDVPLAELMIKRIGWEASERVKFSFKTMFENLGFSISFGYKWFFSFFADKSLLKNVFYIVLAAVLAALLIMMIVRFAREGRFPRVLVIVVTVILFPLALNFCLVVFPTNGMRDILRYQYVMLFVLLFFLLEKEKAIIAANVLKYIAYICVFALIAGNTITAHATAYMYKIAYNYSINQGELMLARLYELDGYVPNETPVVLTNAIDWSHLLKRYPEIMKYEQYEGGPVFWGGSFGMDSSRYHFFYDYLGMDFKEFNMEDYYRIIDSYEFQNMPAWPAEGSVRMFGRYAVIKNGEEPAR